MKNVNVFFLEKDIEGLDYVSKSKTKILCENNPYVFIKTTEDKKVIVRDKNNVDYIIEENQDVLKNFKYKKFKSIFLAGGCNSSWRKDLIKEINDKFGDKILIFDPYREDYKQEFDWRFNQTVWENHTIDGSCIIAFWFENSGSPQPMSLIEFGQVLNDYKTFVVGIEKGYKHEQDILLKCATCKRGTCVNDWDKFVKNVLKKIESII